MSEQGFGDPPEGGPGAPPPAGGGWEPVNTPAVPPVYSAPPPQYPPQPPYGAPPPQYPPPPAYGGPPPPYPPPPGQYPPPGYVAPPPAASGLSESSASALAYVTFIPAIIFLVMEPYNRSSLIKFHAWQSIVLTLVWIVVSIAFIPLAFVHLFGLTFLLHMLVRLLLFVAWLVAIIQASKGVRFKLPIIGDLAESFGGKV
jgi:uncharacterized membrane protein